MLEAINGSILTIKCNHCGTEFTDDITGKTLNYSEDVGAYPNYQVICPNCSTMEFFNMNLPPIEEDYPLELMPENEQVNRTNVRKLKELLLSNAAQH